MTETGGKPALGNGQQPGASAPTEPVLAAILENATVSLLVMDERQHCTYMNPAAEMMTGFTLAEVQGKPLHDFVHHTHPDGSPYPLQECPIDSAFPNRKQEQGEEVFVRKDGSFYPVAYTASPVFREGVIVGTVLEVRDLTEEKEAQRSLRDSNERFRTLVDSHAAIIWMSDSGGRMQESPHWQDFTGQSADEMKDWGWLEAIHPDERDRFVAEWKEALDAGSSTMIDFRLWHRNGEYRHVYMRATPITDDAGHVTEWISIVVDVHESEQARESLREAHALLEAALSAGQVLTFVWDIANDRMVVNEWFAHLFSVDPKKAREGLPLDQFIAAIHEDDRRHVQDAVARAVEQGGPYSEDYRVWAADGSLHWVAARGYVQYDSQGKPVKFPGALVDITQRKQYEVELQEQNLMLEQIERASLALNQEVDLEQLVQLLTDIGVEITGARFGAFFYNRVSEDGEAYVLYTLSGVPREAFEGYPMPRNTEVFGPTFRGEGVVRSDDITADPRYGRNPPYNGMPEGHLPVRSYLAVPVISRTGEIFGGLYFGHPEPGVFNARLEKIMSVLANHAAVAVDNARLYQESKHMNRTLERQVDERTADLRAINEELESFNYSVSHDLRGPLRGIDGFSQALLEDYSEVLGDEGKEFLRRIRGAAQRMSDLIDDMLNLSRINRASLVFEEVKLDDLAGEIVNGLRMREPQRRVDFDIEPGMMAEGDPALVRILLENLLENAWKFTRSRDVARIEFRSTPKQEGVFLIKDNGVGFDEAYSEKLFAPFQRLHGDEFEGTGIGLATVRRVVQRHGGAIWAESTLGEGSSFYFTLGTPRPSRD